MSSRYKKIWLNSFIALAILFCAGCKTYTPQPVKNKEASIGSDGKKDSGFKGFSIDDAGVTNGIITLETKLRYDDLIKLYGRYYDPKIEKGFGIADFTNGTFLINPNALVKFQSMNRWKKEGLPPKIPIWKKWWFWILCAVGLAYIIEKIAKIILWFKNR